MTTTTTPSATASVNPDRLHALIREELPFLVEFRHDLHAHPELRYEEVRTSQRVRKALTTAGVEFIGDLAGGTGVLAHIPGQDTSSAIGLRADMDALPIHEETGLDYASKNDGTMHACGHDGHTTVLLGAARVLKRIADETGLPRSVKFVFQPAEEGGAGGKRMVEDGVLGDQLLGPAVSNMYGLHCWPPLEVGRISTRVGPLLAAADMFHLKVRGQGSHAAWPHFSNDPIVAGSMIVTALQTLASRNVDPLDPIVLSVTTFHGGTANNIIPEAVKLSGTLRTLSDSTSSFAKTRMLEIAQNVAAAQHCAVELEWEGEGYPVTLNDKKAVEYVMDCARSAVGAENTVHWPVPTMGGEDFAFYCQEVPSCFFLLGQQPRGAKEPRPSVHTPRFNFNDDSIALGVEMFCRIALGMRDDS